MKASSGGSASYKPKSPGMGSSGGKSGVPQNSPKKPVNISSGSIEPKIPSKPIGISSGGQEPPVFDRRGVDRLYQEQEQNKFQAIKQLVDLSNSLGVEVP